MKNKTSGKVYLVGAGPGDPGLMTVRGAELIHSGDAVVVDDLVNPVLLKDVRGNVYYVGKRGHGAPQGKSIKRSQSDINRLLVRLAKQGHRVVRLKGGDPIVFGRGGEEMTHLKKYKIRFEVVPGITSAVAAPAYAGIPITDRRWSSQVTFLTGVEKSSRIPWSRLGHNQTLVVLMGVSRWPAIQKELIRGKWKPNTPVAAIQSGTQKNQRFILTHLKSSVREFKRKKLRSPAIVVVGDVSKLGRTLAWVEKEKPLLGRRIVITRPEDQSHRMVRLLHDKGADVIPCPTIEIVPLHGDPDVQEFFSRFNKGIDAYDWIVFLSANAVKIFAEGLSGDRKLPPTVRVGAVGPQTAQMIRSHGWRVHRVAAGFNSSGVIKALGRVDGKRILIPRVLGGPSEMIQAFRAKGASVRELAIYQNRPAPPPSPIVRKLVMSGVDAVAFTSASTARNFSRLFRPADINKIFRDAFALSIGSQTSAAIRQAGIRKIVQSKKETVVHMVDELCRRFR